MFALVKVRAGATVVPTEAEKAQTWAQMAKKTANKAKKDVEKRAAAIAKAAPAAAAASGPTPQVMVKERYVPGFGIANPEAAAALKQQRKAESEPQRNRCACAAFFC